MAHVYREPYTPLVQSYTPAQIMEIMKQPRWQTVTVLPPQQLLEDNFQFLNDAVVLRSNPEGTPLMVTRGIYGPISSTDTVSLDINSTAPNGLQIISSTPPPGPSLIEELDHNFMTASESLLHPDATALISAKWIAATEGGAIPGLDASANVFGMTGSLLINVDYLDIPVLNPVTEQDLYFQTLDFYGGKLLVPGEPFYMGYYGDGGSIEDLWGMDYDQTLPDYIRNYAMDPRSGGGLFVEHHPFPHVFFPYPDGPMGEVNSVSRITLGRKSPASTPEAPRYHFTTFMVPSDGSALAIRPGTIHNDSYTQGQEIVFVGNTQANTVALRATAPYKEIRLKDTEPKIDPTPTS